MTQYALSYFINKFRYLKIMQKRKSPLFYSNSLSWHWMDRVRRTLSIYVHMQHSFWMQSSSQLQIYWLFLHYKIMKLNLQKRISPYQRLFSSIFLKSTNNIVALVGDNRAVNKLVARLLDAGFFGCALHRFNVVVKDIIYARTKAISLVLVVKKKITYPACQTALRVHTNLASVKSNITQWSSVFVLLQRQQEIRQHLCRLRIEEIDEVPLSICEYCDSDKICENLQKIDTVT